MTGRSQVINVTKMRGNLRETTEDSVAIEEPLEIRLGYEDAGKRRTRSVSITMRTPGDDEDLATGFLFTESIIRSPDDIAIIKPCDGDNTLRMELEDGVDVDLDRLQRHFYTSSSCGVCGKASLDALRATGLEPLPAIPAQFSRDVLVDTPGRLRAMQETFAKTGGLHAAAAFGSDGELLVVREDIGRHNAVDKVIGALFRAARLPARDLGLMVSGRASFELMQKAAVAGMPLLAAVSAPSSLAVELAREFNVTLVGFLRGDTFNVYAGEERIAE
ncbi:MAG: formate dehydrogenase accessory sulfurtransferase FdhD [Gammaproteobacteria bacterium]|jgi:FdhD protein|nr:formate dehydrogenase accessory sulfurtransferase FdhD [Gammaproteobacteria bacterium]MDH3821029.1 formate dehydrogenase accessory sulfurtransferase FdhD [Gammaproteobacteria bacterium]MDH3982848.1 formate dehydrogenase accessory sulfurtransferase FdhD [Gammaproteobacteria bacterium]